ncbi:MAG: FGGY-family carbohydrate kinase [Clostridiales bacterium]|jgi:sugar (pentulose or hexulose) kinase|nr:FGGY-family carbohydrate kinase [Clostridiales bacterium]
MQKTTEAIWQGKTILGIEFGSTRIKSVLTDENLKPIATGNHEWENRLENNIWTYRLEDVWAGMQASFSELATAVREGFNAELRTVGAIGVSAMMHGFLAFDKNDGQLAQFRTWRNTVTEEAAEKLTAYFGFNIPQRWSIAHLHQAILNKESHVRDIAYLTTLAGYVHWRLTGEKAVGVCDASGMFPIDSMKNTFHAGMLRQYDELIAGEGFGWKIEDILPQVKNAGEPAGKLTPQGARLLDPFGKLAAGIPFCPPEGDAGTGMVATNSVAERTGNVSAGTSIFAMLVLEKPLSHVYPEIDMVTTPTGRPVAMVHCNNCTSDLDAWVRLFGEAAGALGAPVAKDALYATLYNKAFEGECDCGGLLTYNFFAGEHITGLEEGRPLLARMPDSRFTVANLMRALLFSALGTLKIGMDILTEEEHVRVRQLVGHGGFFKTGDVGQRMIAGALGAPVAVMRSAGEGGAWGIAILAAYMLARQTGEKADRNIPLEEYLEKRVFAGDAGLRAEPDDEVMKSFAVYIKRYKRGLEIEKAAIACLT